MVWLGIQCLPLLYTNYVMTYSGIPVLFPFRRLQLRLREMK